MARAIADWVAAHSHIQITGGTRLSYPSVTIWPTPAAAHGGAVCCRCTAARAGEHPVLEIRIGQMCRTPPYHHPGTCDRLIADLRALGIPRLDTGPALTSKRPDIPFGQLADGCIDRLLATVDGWIDDVGAHAADPDDPEDQPGGPPG